jgi:chromosome segregation and condensation protein ScpB
MTEEALPGVGEAVESLEPAGDAPAIDLPGDAVSEAMIEALLFVAERPLGRRELATLTGASAETVDARLGDLEVTLAGRGIRLLVDGNRVALATAPEAGLLIGRYVGREPTRLAAATLESRHRGLPPARDGAAIERFAAWTRSTPCGACSIASPSWFRSADAPGRPILYGTRWSSSSGSAPQLDDLPLLDAAVAERLVTPEPPPESLTRAAPAGSSGP